MYKQIKIKSPGRLEVLILVRLSISLIIYANSFQCQWIIIFVFKTSWVGIKIVKHIQSRQINLA